MAELEKAIVTILKSISSPKSSPLLMAFVSFLNSATKKKKKKIEKIDLSYGLKQVPFRTMGTHHG